MGTAMGNLIPSLNFIKYIRKIIIRSIYLLGCFIATMVAKWKNTIETK